MMQQDQVLEDHGTVEEDDNRIDDQYQQQQYIEEEDTSSSFFSFIQSPADMVIKIYCSYRDVMVSHFRCLTG